LETNSVPKGETIVSCPVALLVAFVFAFGIGNTMASAQPPKDPPKAQPKAPPATRELLNINSASADDLKALKGLGEADAKKIVENRPYRTKDELVQKKVISQATYDKIKDRILAK
jgi:DNA uptake protein ComE-like DNA-binding protein